jgi:cytoskeletal protein CcmA (bactofilin family)
MKFGKDNRDAIVSLLGEGVEITGEISFTNGLRVDGTINGKIHSEAALVIGPKGRVQGQILIRRVSINGEFRGDIHASERVEIHREGKVYGDLYTPCLIIEAGALFEGKCNMSETRAAKAPEGSVLRAVDPPPEAKTSVGSSKIG